MIYLKTKWGIWHWFKSHWIWTCNSCSIFSSRHILAGLFTPYVFFILSCLADLLLQCCLNRLKQLFFNKDHCMVMTNPRPSHYETLILRQIIIQFNVVLFSRFVKSHYFDSSKWSLLISLRVYYLCLPLEMQAYLTVRWFHLTLVCEHLPTLALTNMHPHESHTGNNLTMTTKKLLDSLLSSFAFIVQMVICKTCLYCECGWLTV